MTALHIACEAGHFAVAKYLIENYGANINKLTSDGVNCLNIAMEATLDQMNHISKETFFDFLISKGARKDTYSSKTGQNLLLSVISGGDFSLALKIISGEDAVDQILFEGVDPSDSTSTISIFNFMRFRNQGTISRDNLSHSVFLELKKRNALLSSNKRGNNIFHLLSRE